MQPLSLLLVLFLSSPVISQENPKTKFMNPEPVLQKTEPLILYEIDISTIQSYEQGFILYMESLSDQDAMRLFQSMVDGEIVYKKEKE